MDGEIGDILNGINNRIFLPGLQREFVWKPKQIESFFDSLIREYPVGIITIWKAKSGTITEYTTYEFLQSYVASDHKLPDKIGSQFSRYNNEANEADAEFLIIDGQQRLNSLYIGVCGRIAEYMGGQGRKSSKARNWTEKVLCINLFGHPSYDSGDEIAGDYQFQFRSTGALGGENQRGYTQRGGEHQLWIPVNEFWASNTENSSGGHATEPSEVNGLIKQRINDAPIPETTIKSSQLRDIAKEVGRDVRGRILDAKLDTKNIKKDRSKIPEIFQRLNRKGEQPKPYQLLMSQMMSYWPYRDDDPINPRKEIAGWVSEFKSEFPEYEQQIQRRLFVRYSAYLINVDLLLSKLEYISEEDLDRLHTKWTYTEPTDHISGYDWFEESLKKAFRTIIETGVRPGLLNTMPVFLILAVFYYENPNADVEDNKNEVFRFISRSKLLNQAGYQSVAYGKCRNYRRYILNWNDEEQSPMFPGDELLENEGLTLSRSDVDSAVRNSRYDGGDSNETFTNSDVISVLGLIEESYKTDDIGDYEVDHIFPRQKSEKVNRATEKTVDLDRIGNLQLLPKEMNKQKGSNLPGKYYAGLPGDASSTLKSMNQFPEDVDLNPENAAEFIDKREEKIIKYLIDRYVGQPRVQSEN